MASSVGPVGLTALWTGRLEWSPGSGAPGRPLVVCCLAVGRSGGGVVALDAGVSGGDLSNCQDLRSGRRQHFQQKPCLPSRLQTLLWTGVFTGWSGSYRHASRRPHPPGTLSTVPHMLTAAPRARPSPTPHPVDFSSAVPLGRHGLSARKPWPAASIARLRGCSLALEASCGHFLSTCPTLLIPG